MKQAIKRKWITALRSGKFKQGKRRLKNTDGTFCCLGVLACLVDPTNTTDWQGEVYLGETQKELTGPFGKIGAVDADWRLTELNDGSAEFTPKSFNYIASYIERFL